MGVINNGVNPWIGEELCYRFFACADGCVVGINIVCDAPCAVSGPHERRVGHLSESSGVAKAHPCIAFLPVVDVVGRSVEQVVVAVGNFDLRRTRLWLDR
ncbi:hypothetical protein ACPXCG_21535 [Gordonia sp. DT218]|uniref:hypothetical protein n=1 Tax=Gordonia sp. DT218 TaxID=3416659 RepID=UPI003CE839B4